MLASFCDRLQLDDENFCLVYCGMLEPAEEEEKHQTTKPLMMLIRPTNQVRPWSAD